MTGANDAIASRRDAFDAIAKPERSGATALDACACRMAAGVAAPVRSGLACDVRPRRLLGDIHAAWSDLARRAVEPNVFAEPQFALAGAGAGASPSTHDSDALLVWGGEPGQASRTLRGLFPVAPASPVPFLPARLSRSIHAACGVPLVDAENFDAVMTAFLAELSRRRPASGGVIIPLAHETGAFATALDAYARRTGRAIGRLEGFERAILPAGETGDDFIANALSPKKLKELRRQLRRLGDAGDVRFEVANAPEDVAAAVETFLALEGSGWKRENGTAMVQDPTMTAHARAFARAIAEDGRCRVDTLWAGATPVATGIVIESGARAWFWKVAYDEAFARYSPGVQLTLHITATQLARDDIAVTDSGAIANHPMIDHLWRDRMPVADLFVPFAPGFSAAARLSHGAERTRLALRGHAKRLYHKLKKGKVS